MSKHRKKPKKKADALGISSCGCDVAKATPSGAEFSIEEVAIARALADAFLIPIKEVLAELDAILARNGQISELVAAVESIAPAMRVVATSVRPEIANGVSRAILRGGNVVEAAGVIESSASVRLVQNGIVSSLEFHANLRFEGDTLGKIMSDINTILSNPDPTDFNQIRSIRGSVERRLGELSTSYSDVTANAATNRSYNYGVLKGGQATGFRTYRYVAIMDGKTSLICRWMNGRKFFVANALAQAERAAQVVDPLEVKSIMPWPKVNDVVGNSTAELRAAGVTQPPLHGNCRSVIVLEQRF